MILQHKRKEHRGAVHSAECSSKDMAAHTVPVLHSPQQIQVRYQQRRITRRHQSIVPSSQQLRGHHASSGQQRLPL